MNIEIPEGYEARIEGNKVVLEPKENEDEGIRKGLIAMLSQDKELHHKEIAYLERKKEQKSAEWSEEDENYLEEIIDDLRFCERNRHSCKNNGVIKDCINWLNNRIKPLRLFGDYHKGFIAGFNKAKEMHYNAWKPSDEQMRILAKVSDGQMLNKMEQMSMETLYDELYKLLL